VWRPAYDQINTFEEGLVREGAILLKFWIHISKEERLPRFRERGSNPFEHWKIGVEDWRLVESEYKWVGRIKLMRAMADALRAALRSLWKKPR